MEIISYLVINVYSIFIVFLSFHKMVILPDLKFAFKRKFVIQFQRLNWFLKKIVIIFAFTCCFFLNTFNLKISIRIHFFVKITCKGKYFLATIISYLFTKNLLLFNHTSIFLQRRIRFVHWNEFFTFSFIR